jgi:hypothetical protein
MSAVIDPMVTSWDSLPVLMTMNDVRQLMRLSKDRTYELRFRAGFPVIKVGRSLRVPRDAFRY